MVSFWPDHRRFVPVPATAVAPIQNVSVLEGKQATLVCRVDGFPAPRILWSGPDGTVLQNLTGVPNLTLTNVSRRIAGFYRCNAANELGSAEAAGARLVVLCECRFFVCLFFSSQPPFDEFVRPRGNNKTPELQGLAWLYYAHLNQRQNWSESVNKLVCTQYFFMKGWRSFRGFVAACGPGRCHHLQKLISSGPILWRTNFDHGVNVTLVAPKTRISRDREIGIPICAEIFCTDCTMIVLLYWAWELSGLYSALLARGFPELSAIDTVRNLVWHRWFRIRAWNGPSAPFSHQTDPPLLKFCPGNLTVDERQNVSLRAWAEGQPPPSVAWVSPVGTVLQNKTERSNFTITNITRERRGSYRCNARNSVGTDVKRFFIDVRCECCCMKMVASANRRKSQKDEDNRFGRQWAITQSSL